MSVKRTSAESNDDEQQNEGSDSLLLQGNYAKHAKLASLSDTTLQDLPMELIEFILIKVVVMEVKDMKLVKSVWKEKADLVINRLRTVCSHWSSILTTSFFRNELHRTLDTTAQQKIRLEILYQSQIPFNVFELTTLKDDMFIICAEATNIIVYNRNGMTRLEDVITPPGTFRREIAGCNVSNCVYVLSQEVNFYSMLRITKDDDNQFNISPWVNGPSLPFRLATGLSVSANGSLIILSWGQGKNHPEASIYDANGHLQRKVMVPTGILGSGLWDNAILKSNGNLVLIYFNDQVRSELAEIDANGSIERKYKPSGHSGGVKNGIHFADISGRYVITEMDSGIKLLDSELNLLDFTGPQLNGGRLHYSSERNEIVSIVSSISLVGNYSSAVTIFRFTEE